MTIAPVKLPRLFQNWEKQPDLFKRYWDAAMRSIETTLNSIIDLPALQAAAAAATDAAAAATTAATDAQNAADTAQAAADSATTSNAANALANSLANSGVINEGFALQSDSSGNITIGSHDRAYGDSVLNPTVSVNGGSASSGGTADDTVYVYYHDSTRAGGIVTYLTSFDPSDALQQLDVHSIGVVIVPTSGFSTGSYTRPSGIPY